MDTTPRPITEIAAGIGLLPEEVEQYGHYKAKISLAALQRLADRPNGKYIDVTAITPTPLGEGKTVTTIGLSMALNHIGVKAACCLRQPSMGPVFGIKGGGAGSGHSQIIPLEEINLHLTGDIHAVGAAHNLLSAAIDNSLLKGTGLNLDPMSITWPRVVDISDRVLRHIVVGLGGPLNGIPRESGFDITVASEIMAILALSSDLHDLRARLDRIVIGNTFDGKPVTAKDLQVAGALAVIMRDAVKPNLMQTIEHTPCFVHAGPFANIAQGNNSIIADRLALKLMDYVVTESGFGADLGMEKFMDIKCRVSGLVPNAVVVVATIRALKMHGGVGRVVAGKALPPELVQENLPALEKGSANLVKQIENARKYGVPVVVAINLFPTDTDREINLLQRIAVEAGAEGAYVSEVWASGGAGGADLAQAVVRAADKSGDFHFLYPLDIPIKEKIETIAREIYGADGVDYLPEANKMIKLYTEMGFDKLPICMAKTHLSLSHDPNLKNAPKGWRLPVRDVRVAAGAGFIYPLCGEMTTMPGLPSKPAYMNMDIDAEGNPVGLF
ncbi:MAG: formate--tetrahydrofolate ligase [Chloroflexi bacterium]|nr:formate--tetrahydrofolate ligase [Chloroflexota bacterium]